MQAYRRYTLFLVLLTQSNLVDAYTASTPIGTSTAPCATGSGLPSVATDSRVSDTCSTETGRCDAGATLLDLVEKLFQSSVPAHGEVNPNITAVDNHDWDYVAAAYLKQMAASYSSSVHGTGGQSTGH